MRSRKSCQGCNIAEKPSLQLAFTHPTANLAYQPLEPSGGLDERDFITAIGALDEEATSPPQGALLTHRRPCFPLPKLEAAHRTSDARVVSLHWRHIRDGCFLPQAIFRLASHVRYNKGHRFDRR
ncbi:MAG: hypothetical protein IMHGJWDQ_002273 [Candidatus Fervidibacter sp.]